MKVRYLQLLLSFSRLSLSQQQLADRLQFYYLVVTSFALFK